MSARGFSYLSEVTQRTALVGATTATSAQVLPANFNAQMRTILNKTDGAIRVYLCDLATKQAENGGAGIHTTELAVGGYWEDPRGYQGPITIESVAYTTGKVLFTEWL